MKRTPVSIILVLSLVFTASFAPLGVEAAEPRKSDWSPYDLGARVSALALAREGGMLLAGLAAPDQCNPAGPAGTVPGCVNTNIVRINHGTGPDFTTKPNSTFPVRVARSDVAITGAGTSWVSVEPRNGTGQNVYHVSLADPQKTWTAALPEKPRAVDISADGSVIVVVDGDLDDRASFRSYTDAGFRTVSWKARGVLSSVATSGDGQWAVAGGRSVIAGNLTPAIHLFANKGTAPTFTWEAPGSSLAGVTSVAISRDGRYFVGGLENGDVIFFENAGAGTSRSGTVLKTGTAPVRAIAMSDDGSRVFVAHGQGLTAFRLQGRLFENAWTIPATDGYNDVATTGRGGLVLAGGPSGLRAFPADGSRALFERQGSFSYVELSRDGSSAAYARGSIVEAGAFLARLGFGFRGPGDLPALAPDRVQSIPANGSGVVELVVENEGLRADRVRIEVPKRFEASFTPNLTEFDVAPATRRVLALTIRPSIETGPGDYSVNVSAVSVVTGERANLTVPYAVPQTVDFKLSVVGGANRSLLKGQAESLVVVVDNRKSNDEIVVKLSAVQAPSAGPQWTFEGLPADGVPVPRGSSSTFRVRVNVPAETPNGTTNTIAILAATQTGGAVSETVFYTVNPVVRVNVTTETRLKLVPPGERVVMAVTVGNNGTVPARFVLSYDAKATGGRIWNVDLPPIAFTGFDMAAGTTQTFPVTVTPPANANEDDRVVITFNVASLHENQLIRPVSWNMDVYVHVQNRAPEPKTEDYQSPGLALPAIVLAIVAIALFARRRSPS